MTTATKPDETRERSETTAMSTKKPVRPHRKLLLRIRELAAEQAAAEAMDAVEEAMRAVAPEPLTSESFEKILLSSLENSIERLEKSAAESARRRSSTVTATRRSTA